MLPEEKKKLLIYVPAFNSGSTISELIERISMIAASFQKIELFRMVVIDDGSTDNTLEMLSGLAKEHPFLKISTLGRNMGPVAALFAGMSKISAELGRMENPEETIILRMDSDLEHQPEDIPVVLGPLLHGNYGVSVGVVPFEIGRASCRERVCHRV